MIVRNARPLDRPTLVRFMAALQEFERGLEANRTPGGEMAEGHLTALESWAAEHPAGGVLVAKIANQLVGFIIFGVDRAMGTYVPEKTRSVGRISDLWVEPDHRGCGVTRALIDAAEARLRGAGLKRVEIYAVAGNANALRLYQALGYGPYEVSLAKRL
ncbi:MAG TPA: GNAT family N-acetyltransferase [Thermohalobaculum sp.]|nr:GNAT family N-acetyltransferase [Thermohalobaculum sp.]